MYGIQNVIVNVKFCYFPLICVELSISAAKHGNTLPSLKKKNHCQCKKKKTIPKKKHTFFKISTVAVN